MTNINSIKSKIHTTKDIPELLNVWKKKYNNIVFTNGCFDILHMGHIDYLAKAADMGDFFVVGLNTDNSIKKIKGNKRPIVDEKSRAFVLASLFFVDAVILFEEETPLSLITEILPKYLIKGKDYKESDVVGYDVVTSSGGKVLTLDLLDGYSTSLIEKKIIDSNK